MNKRKGIVKAALVHLIVWSVLLLCSGILRIWFELSSRNLTSMEHAFSGFGFNLFLFVTAAGALVGILLFLSLRKFVDSSDLKKKGRKKVVLCISVAVTAFFYFILLVVVVECIPNPVPPPVNDHFVFRKATT